MGAHYVTLQKYFSPPSFNLFAFFPTPPMKLKLGSQIGERLLIVTHLDLLNYLAHQQQVCHLPASAYSATKMSG